MAGQVIVNGYPLNPTQLHSAWGTTHIPPSNRTSVQVRITPDFILYAYFRIRVIGISHIALARMCHHHDREYTRASLRGTGRWRRRFTTRSTSSNWFKQQPPTRQHHHPYIFPPRNAEALASPAQSTSPNRLMCSRDTHAISVNVISMTIPASRRSSHQAHNDLLERHPYTCIPTTKEPDEKRLLFLAQISAKTLFITGAQCKSGSRLGLRMASQRVLGYSVFFESMVLYGSHI